MNNETISKLFPSYYCAEVDEVLKIAVSNANSMQHAEFNIEHILFGYMKYVEKKATSKSNKNKLAGLNWLIPASKYKLKAYSFPTIPTGTDFEFNADIYKLSRYYMKIFGEYTAELSLKTFYLLILFMQQNNLFKFKYYVPSEKITSAEYESQFYYDFVITTFEFDNSPNDIYSKSCYKSVSSESKNVKPMENLTSELISSFYSSPLKIDCTTDITYMAKEKESFTMVGRKRELSRLIDILCKMEKNNAVLLGNPGVGKTAIVHALAQAIVTGNVPKPLKFHRILELNMTEAIAGCKYRGDFEKRIHEIFREIENSSEQVILCIDEIHTIVGLGDAQESLDMSAIIKPLLLKSNIQVIGTSTFKDYRRLEADKALERRFSTIIVNEPTYEETLDILTGIKSRFEQYYNVHISQKTLEAVITLSQRYIPERYLPDKAIDVLDESCSSKVNYIHLFHYTKILEILPQDILVCISRKKMIPLDKVQAFCDFENLEKNLNSKIIGQAHIIDILNKAIRRTQAGLNDTNRPFASFLFIGPTGVGKTEVAKTLADLMFSGRNSMIKFDMSEYQEEHSISKLIGAPPGYEGFKDAGLLTEQVRRHPYSLILFDEIEKAHPKVFTLLLQVLDEGILTDSHGEHVNFKNTIIILTSNVGVRDLSKNSVGFVEQANSKSHDIMTAVKNTFQPEFLNRLDEIVTFNWLTPEDILKITKLCVSTDIISVLEKRGIHVTVSDDVIQKIAELGYNHEYGARELKRTITRELKNPLADLLLQNTNARNIAITLNNNELSVEDKTNAVHA